MDGARKRTSGDGERKKRTRALRQKHFKPAATNLCLCARTDEPWISLAVTGSRPGDRSRARGGHARPWFQRLIWDCSLVFWCPLQSAQEQKQRRPRYMYYYYTMHAEQSDATAKTKRRDGSSGAVWMDSRKQNVSIPFRDSNPTKTKKKKQRFLYWFLHARQNGSSIPVATTPDTPEKQRVPKQMLAISVAINDVG